MATRKTAPGRKTAGTTSRKKSATTVGKTSARKTSAGKAGTAATGKRPPKGTAPTKRSVKKATAKTGASARKAATGKSTATAKGSVGSLSAYKAKRDFARTAEPEGHQHAESPSKLRFVIQKHAASHLHFDFRLELDGVMKSWAVPKGPHYDPKVRRLAMHVEDHPIEYNTFEGTIPQGEYGGGTVMIWDRGTYEPESGGGDDALRAGYKRGDMKFIMHGERMIGGWVLVRTRTDDRGKQQWLLIKHRDEYAQSGFDVVALATTSIVSGRSMEEIAQGDEIWHSNRKARR